MRNHGGDQQQLIQDNKYVLRIDTHKALTMIEKLMKPMKIRMIKCDHYNRQFHMIVE
jgi:phage anti-repressor protein